MVFNVNQYQTFTFIYPDPTAGLYINNPVDNIGFYFNGTDYNFEVDNFTTVSSNVFDVYDSLGNPYDTITLNVLGVVPSFSIVACLSDSIPFQILPPPPVGTWEISGNYYPEWLNVYIAGFEVQTVPTVGVFNVLFQDSGDPLNSVLLIRFTFTSCLTEYNFCSPQSFNVVWFNRAGGWSSYCFKGKKTYEVKIADKRIYKNSSGEQKYYNIDGVFDSIQVLSGELPISHADFVKSLKYSIQAYIKNSGGFVPILIEDKDFTLRTDGDGLFYYDISVKYSNEIMIQTQ